MREPATRATEVEKLLLIESGFTFRMRCRPLRGLVDRCARAFLELTPQTLRCRQLRWLGAAIVLGIFSLSTASEVVAQSSQSGPATSQLQASADPNRYVVIISGASGEPAYAKQFQQWTSSLQAALLERFGFPKNRVKLLVEKPTDPATAPATADEVKKLFSSLRTELNSDSVLFVFLIGHGSFDKEAKFNLVGPDLSANEYNNLLAALPTQRVVVFNMASASGEFIKPLTAKGRVIVTATRSGQENNAARFMEYFLAALKANDADADQDGHISVLEAFNYANRLTAEFYTRAGRLATEHALLEDNGDGVGHTKMEGGDGLLARATYLDSLTVAQAAANATVAKLMRDRTRLEGEIAQLIGRKSSMPEADYEKELERLFIELAKVNRAIKQGSNASEE